MELLKRTTKSILRMPTIEDIPYCICLFLLCRAAIFDTHPMALPFFAAVCDLNIFYIYLPFVIIGSLTVKASIIKNILSICLYWMLSEFRIHTKDKLTNAVLCVILSFISALPELLFSETSAAYLLSMLSESILSGIIYYCFSNINLFLDRYEYAKHVSYEEIFSFVVFVCSLLLGLCGITLPLNFNVAQLVGIYLILCTVTYLNTSLSVVFALAVGFVSPSVSSDCIIMMGTTALSALFASILKHFGKFGTVLGFLFGVAVAFVCSTPDHPMPISLISLFFAPLMFLLTPAFIHSKLNNFYMSVYYPDSSKNDMRIKYHISRELKSISKAFSKLSLGLLDAYDKNSYYSSSFLFENILTRICSECPYHSSCENLAEAKKQIFSVIDIMEEYGYCDKSNIPIVFSQKCKFCDTFIREFNHTFEICKEHSLSRTEVDISRYSVALQYKEISEIIDNLSGSVEFGFYILKDAENRIYRKCVDEKISLYNVSVIENTGNLPEVYINTVNRAGSEKIKKIVSSAMNMPMRVFKDNDTSLHLVADNIYYPEFSIKQKNKDGHSISGDTVLTFETHNNKFYFILCDGMGSGKSAYDESQTTANLLYEFINSDIKPETAIEMINSSMALKNNNEIFSTADILEIDLINGCFSIFKIGSAESYTRLSGKLETLYSKNLPIGILDEINANTIKRKFSNGDMIVLVSDGVSEVGYGTLRGEWIKKIMSYNEKTTDEIASLIINDAGKKVFPHPGDDMTAIVVRLYKI